MASDRERIEALERTARMLAETTRGALFAMRGHMHEGQFAPPDHQLTGKIDRALGQINAVLSALGAAAEGGGA